MSGLHAAAGLDGGFPASAAAVMDDILALLGDRSTLARQPGFRIEEAGDPATLNAYRRLRRQIFVHEQGLFDDHDLDDHDADPRTVVLVARGRDGSVVGGVRLGPVGEGPDLGWWTGGRLVVAAGARGPQGVGAALVRAACARAEAQGVLRFEATVQARNETPFRRLGWRRVRAVTVAGTPHVLMRRPIGRIAAQAAATKSALGPLLAGLAPGGPGFVGDDGAPVPGSDLVAACDAIVPSMVEREPEWAGWCSVLVNVNDLSAMGATPVGLLDAVGARDASHAARVLAGLRHAAAAYGVPVLGGHTQLGVPAALAVTALGRTDHPVPGGGGRPGHRVRLTADLGGTWRAGHRGRQWDSTTSRSGEELRLMLGAVAAARPAAAKDVSMAGIAGTLGMLAEASGCAAILDVAAVPRPEGASLGDWLSCFPGFAMLTADERGGPALRAGPAVGGECGELTAGHGVRLRWPDGELTEAVTDAVTGMGTA
ncbi:putative N-acetyltransferase, MSMEG_0567 N-terminal domain family [Streptosporangium subroseum]|uniref:Putative N-acetyltransferase, MSMEG_0567 N-terminal domain family n=1 Tax=Streptosporangium subroseum TaxID=106412 RepID=A0A239HMB9_9ACTN|nr:MSMEG_0567/sll0787 family protein [Streptosporangium subroseum]SNS82487.1 putative N-acetyltransferase, MSMEG_0567 N-terminal domain family [Streptosporangium subroseum]